MRLNLTPPEFMALYSTLVKLDGQVNIQDRMNVRIVVDRMHSCLISALLRKEESDKRDATHTEITDRLFNEWENDQKAKIESLKTAPVNTVSFGGVEWSKDKSDVKETEVTVAESKLASLPNFLTLDEEDLKDDPTQSYPRKHRPAPPPPQLPKNRKWRGKHKKLRTDT